MKQILYKLFEHQYLGRDERCPGFGILQECIDNQ